jgi:hypothetical protein
MRNDSHRNATFLGALDQVQGRARLLIPDPTPLHSLWIAKHLHLLLEYDLEVAILDSVRAMFAAHPDCRKGAEVTAFLEANSPPLTFLSSDPGRLEPYLAKTGQIFILTGEKDIWNGTATLPHVDLVTTTEFVATAERLGLVADAHLLAQLFRLPGEITAWA